MNIILFGVPGAGKGTQSTLLVKRKGMEHISTGNLLRKAVHKKTPLGIEASLYLEKGDLVPDALVTRMVHDVLSTLKERSFILDGFPRTLTQAKDLREYLVQNDLILGKAIFLDVSEELLMERLIGRRLCSGCGMNFHIESFPPLEDGTCSACGEKVVQRPDDREESISKRLEVYHRSTEPLKGYFKELNQLVVLDGTGSQEDVFQRISKVLV